MTIVEVKAWSIDYIDTVNNKEVTLSDGRIDKNPSFKTRNYFNTIQNFLRFKENLIDDTKTTITTYHSSKGLEAKVVIILNINDIKDKKLAYVAMTRASEKLIIHAFNLNEGLASEIQNL